MSCCVNVMHTSKNFPGAPPPDPRGGAPYSGSPRKRGVSPPGGTPQILRLCQYVALLVFISGHTGSGGTSPALRQGVEGGVQSSGLSSVYLEAVRCIIVVVVVVVVTRSHFTALQDADEIGARALCGVTFPFHPTLTEVKRRSSSTWRTRLPRVPFRSFDSPHRPIPRSTSRI